MDAKDKVLETLRNANQPLKGGEIAKEVALIKSKLTRLSKY
jgi:hypothetical protein